MASSASGRAGAHIGCERVNEPNTLVRNDLVTDQPDVTRPFYAEVFGFTLDGNPDLPDFDFTFLRRPDGHEIGGIMGVPSGVGDELVDHVRGRRHRRRAGAGGGRGRDGRTGRRHDLRPVGPDHRPVRNRVLGHRPADLMSPTATDRTAEEARRRRWRLLLGEPAQEPLGVALRPAEREMDDALAALYDDRRGAEGAAGPRATAALGSSAPQVARWLGDIRSYFPTSVVQVHAAGRDRAART